MLRPYSCQHLEDKLSVIASGYTSQIATIWGILGAKLKSKSKNNQEFYN